MKKKPKRKYTKSYFIPACGLEGSEIVTLIASSKEELEEEIKELDESLAEMRRTHKRGII